MWLEKGQEVSAFTWLGVRMILKAGVAGLAW